MTPQYAVIATGPAGIERVCGMQLTHAQAVTVAEQRRLLGLLEHVGIIHPDLEGWVSEEEEHA